MAFHLPQPPAAFQLRALPEATFTNLFLHIHPVKTHVHSLKPWYTMGLGVISLSLFIILGATGFLLMIYYVPSVDQAHNRMLDLSGTVAFGTLLRNMHRWGAHAMVIAVWLHMFRVFMTGSYKPPREFNWVIGVNLLVENLKEIKPREPGEYVANVLCLVCF